MIETLEERLARLRGEVSPDDDPLTARLRSLRAADPEYHRRILEQNRAAQDEERRRRAVERAQENEREQRYADAGVGESLADAGKQFVAGAAIGMSGLSAGAQRLFGREEQARNADIRAQYMADWAGPAKSPVAEYLRPAGSMTANAGTFGLVGEAVGAVPLIAKAAPLVRYGAQVAANAPVVAAMASNPETSTTQLAADLTNSNLLRRLAKTRGGRVAGDVALDAATLGTIEGVPALSRAAGRAASRRFLDVGQGMMEGAARDADVFAGAAQQPVESARWDFPQASEYIPKTGRIVPNSGIPIIQEARPTVEPGILPPSVHNPETGAPTMSDFGQSYSRDFMAGEQQKLEEATDAALNVAFRANPQRALTMTPEEIATLRGQIKERIWKTQAWGDRTVQGPPYPGPLSEQVPPARQQRRGLVDENQLPLGVRYRTTEEAAAAQAAAPQSVATPEFRPGGLDQAAGKYADAVELGTADARAQGMPFDEAQATTADLVEQLAAEQKTLETWSNRVPQGQWTRYDENIGVMRSGDASGIARKQVGYTQRRIARIEAQLKAAGLGDEEIDAVRLDPGFAKERAAQLRENMPPPDSEGHDVLGPDGQVLFSNPVGPALRYGGQLAAAHPTIVGALAGGYAGSEANPEHPWQGAALGAAAGAALGGGAGALLKPRSIHLQLSGQGAFALDQVAKGIDTDGALARAARQAAQSGAGQSVADIVGNWFWRTADRVGNAYGIIDRLGRATEHSLSPTANPRDVLNYVKSTDHTVGRFFREGTLDPTTRQVTGPSYASIFEPFGNDTDAITKFLAYVKAKREVGRVARMGLDAVGGDLAKHQLNVQAVIAGDGNAVMHTAAQRLRQFTDGVGNYAVGSGLWTPEQWSDIQGSDVLYVPFKRILEPTVSPRIAGTGGGGLFNVTDGVKTFRGSEAAVENPAVTLAEYAQNIIRRADRYRAGSAIIDAVEALGPEGQAILSPLGTNAAPLAARRAQSAAMAEAWKQVGLSQPGGSAVLDAFDTQISKRNPVIWRNGPNGEREAFLIHSPGLLRAAEAMNPEYLPEWLRVTLGPLRGLKRLFTATTTALNPRFAGATNPLRDMVEAFAKTEAGLSPADLARGYAEGIAHIFGASPVAREAIDAGLGGTSMFFHEANPSDMARQVAPTSAADKARNVLGGLGAPVKFLEKAGEASDLGPRLAEFMATVNKFGDKVTSGEWTPADLRLRAASNARNITIDFSNRPGSPLLRAFADYIPFFGVGLQAPVQMVAAATRSPARVLAVGTGIAGASALAWAKLNSLSPDVQRAVRDRPATERSAFLLVPIDNKGNVARFPVGAEFGIIHAAVTAALDKVMTDDPHTGRLLAESLVRALPPGVGELTQGNATIPLPGVQQMIEIAKNKTDYGDRPIVPKRLEDVPPGERRTDITSPTYDALASGVRAAGGVTRVAGLPSRLSDFSPLEAEHLMRGVLSNAAPLVTGITDPMAEHLMGRGGAAERVPQPGYQHPLNPVSAVLGRNPPAGTQAESDYYDAREAIKQAETVVSAARNAKDVSSIGHLRPYAPLLGQPLTVVNAADQALKMLRTNELAVTNAFRQKQLDGERARAALDQLRFQRQEVYRRAAFLLRQTGGIQ